MKTNEFLTLLEDNRTNDLVFEYHPGQLVGANYHITEVKNTRIEAVDCGGQSDAWNETVVQLWENPSEKTKTAYLSTFKALGILKKVHSIKPIDQNAEIKFEYGNPDFHTAQLFVNGYELLDNRILIKLSVQRTLCKAEEVCGATSALELEKAGGCDPNSGCC